MEENGQLVKFLYNEDREAVAEEESDGNVIRYIRGLGLVSSDSEKAKTYYHYASDEQGSITHVINGEDKESGELPQENVQPQVLNHYEYDAFGNTVSCEEQVHNRFRYTGEQYDPLTGQYYLRARYYNPVIARFTQEDTYYGDGLNLYTYCQNNPVLYHDPTGHGTKENSLYSRNEQQYIDVGADPDTARLAAQCYPDAKSKQDLYNKYKKQGYSAQDAKKLANYEIVHGENNAKKYAANNVKKSGPDYTATSPRDNVNTDWRTQERLNAQRKATTSRLMPMNLQFFAAKGDENGNKSGSKADVLAQNRANGRAFEQQEFAKFSSRNNNAVEQITVKTSSGVKTRVDAIGLDANGNVVINEYKSSLTAPLTSNQKIAFPELFESGATVVGKGKGIFSGGYQIPPGTKVTIIRPE